MKIDKIKEDSILTIKTEIPTIFAVGVKSTSVWNMQYFSVMNVMMKSECYLKPY